MKRIRINNDLAIEWSILTNGEPMSMEGREIEVEISNTRGYSIKPVVTIQGNTLLFVLRGSEQTSLGVYRVKATDTTNGAMNTLDIADAFELVPHTFMEGGEDTEGLDVKCVQLTSNIDKLIPDTLVMRKLTDLLHRVRYSALDYAFAEDYFKTHYAPIVGGCSVVRKGNKIARNLDWYYDNEVEFIVETDASLGRHAVRGFAATISALTKDIVQQGIRGDMAKILPFRLTDGLNDAGVYASVNVVGVNATRSIANQGTTPNIEERDEVCLAMLVRYILDNFASAYDACEYIRDYVRVYAPISAREGKSEAQVFVADREHSYVLAFEGEQTRIIEGEFHGVLTNFRLADTSLVGGRYTIEGSNIEDYGQGIERANLALETLPTANIEDIINALHYTHAYEQDSDWLTEFVGINGTTIHSDASVLREIQAKARAKYLAISRTKGDIWHTTHTIIYDLDTMSATYATQEMNDGNSYADVFGFSFVDDAPHNGKEYVRQDGEWKENGFYKHFYMSGLYLDEYSDEVRGETPLAISDAHTALADGKILLINCTENNNNAIVTTSGIVGSTSIFSFVHNHKSYIVEITPHDEIITNVRTIQLIERVSATDADFRQCNAIALNAIAELRATHQTEDIYVYIDNDNYAPMHIHAFGSTFVAHYEISDTEYAWITAEPSGTSMAYEVREYINEAPKDGRMYVRKDGEWVALPE